MSGFTRRFLALRDVLRRVAPDLEQSFANYYYTFHASAEESLAATVEWLRAQPLSDDMKTELVTWRLEE